MISKVTITAAELAAAVGGELLGDGGQILTGVAPIEHAGPTDLTFAAAPKYRHLVATTQAGAVITADRLPGRTLIIHPKPHYAFALAVALFHPPDRFEPGIDPHAVIDASASIGSARIGPLAVIGAGAMIADDVNIGAGTIVGPGVRIRRGTKVGPGVRLLASARLGERCIIHAGVVIGADGFGFVEGPAGLVKVPQIGSVRIGNEVEIGANTTIDRGALGDTVIGDGTKIDNLVMIGHNVRVGRHCVIVAQAGIAGSTVIGDRVMIAGQVGIVGHLEIGNDVSIAAQSGVTDSVPDGQTVFGSPALEAREQRRILASLRRLPELIHKLNKS